MQVNSPRLAPEAAPQARYRMTSETKGSERTVPYNDRALALRTASAVAEEMRLGRSAILWIALDDLHAPAASQRIFFCEKKVGQ